MGRMYGLLMRLVEHPWFFWTARALFLTFVRVFYGLRIEGREHVPREGPIVLASNHFSAWDPPVVGSCTPREISFMAKKELFENPVFRLAVRGLHAFPVDRSRNDLGAVKEALRRLKQDRAVGIFIQGTRTADSVEALDGAAFLALRTNAPLVPAAIWRDGRRFRVRFGEPFVVAGRDRAAMRRATAEAMRRILALLPQRARPAGALADPDAADADDVRTVLDEVRDASAETVGGDDAAHGPR